MGAIRIFGAVLFACGVEVTAGGLEVGRIAFGDLVDVDSVLARGQVFEFELEFDFVLLLGQGCGAGILAVGGGDLHCYLGRGGGLRCRS